MIAAFGTGNGPDLNKAFLAALKAAHDRGVVLIDATQCHAGIVNFDEYEVAQGLKGAGCVSAHDMTIESAYAKLCWLLGQSPSLTQKEVERLIGLNLRGELSA